MTDDFSLEKLQEAVKTFKEPLYRGKLVLDEFTDMCCSRAKKKFLEKNPNKIVKGYKIHHFEKDGVSYVEIEMIHDNRDDIK